MKQLFYKLLILFPLCYSLSAQASEINNLKAAIPKEIISNQVMLALDHGNNSSNTAYLINYPTINRLSSCAINSSNGTLSNCSTVGGYIYGLSGIALNTINNQEYVYLLQSANDSVMVCPINNNQSLGSCTYTAPFPGIPNSLSIDSINNRAYLSYGFPFISAINSCAINNDGSLADCTTSNLDYFEPFGLAANGANFVYGSNLTTNPSDSVLFSCSKNAGGLLTNCANQQTLAAPLFNIALNNSGNLLYAINGSGVSACPVDSANGTLGTCFSSGGNVSNPYSLTLNGQFAYLNSISDGLLYVCSIAVNGTFSSCSNAIAQ